MIRARVIGSLFAFLYILSLFSSSDVWFIPTIIAIVGIVLFVVEGIYLFLYGSFVSWNILDKIPTYNELESHIKAGFMSMISFFMVAFGKEKSWNYKAYYEKYLEESNIAESYEEKYFMPAWLIGLPFWNIFTIPSVFIKKYKPYQEVIAQGLIITLIFSFFFFWRGDFASPYLLLMLFPIVHILVFGASEKNIHTPGIGLITWLFNYAKDAHANLKESLVKNTETFTYQNPADSKEKQ